MEIMKSFFNNTIAIIILSIMFSLLIFLFIYHAVVEDQMKNVLIRTNISFLIISIMISIIGYISIIHQKRLVKELEKSNREISETWNRYHMLYDNSPDLYSTLNLDDVRIDCNNSYAEKLGYSKEELIGKKIFEDSHLDKEGHERAKEILNDVKKGSIVLDRKFYLYKKNGDSFPVSISCIPIHDRNGRVIGTNALMRDMTDYYKIKENALSEKLTKLEFLELQKIDKQKDEFVSMVSHELKTPLVPIQGYCDMLKDPNLIGSLNPDQIDAVDQILDSCTKVEKIITDVLDVHKLELNQIQFKRDVFTTDDLITSTFKKFLPTMVKKNITFVKTSSNYSILISDQQRLCQVLANLVVNAVDFVPQEGGRIEIGTQNENDKIIFYVKDNGIGIPEDKIKNLFKKFYQVDTSTKRMHGGSGLGLAICKGIIERLDGEIWVESKVGEGTTFYFSLLRNTNLEGAIKNA